MDTQLVIRAIGVSHTACKDEFRRNLPRFRCHSRMECIFILVIRILSPWLMNGRQKHKRSEVGSQPTTMCQVHTGAYVSLLAPEKPTKPLATQGRLPRMYYTYARQTQVNPVRAPEPLTILNPSKFCPQERVSSCKGVNREKNKNEENIRVTGTRYDHDPGGRRRDTCNQDLTRRSLRITSLSR